MAQPEFYPLAVGPLAASVCTSLPIESATDRLNSEYPTGIASHWTKSDDEFFYRPPDFPNGGPCPDAPDTHRHWLFEC